jgi:pimeloyl-ACP methyl ester carboxylesterase
MSPHLSLDWRRFIRLGITALVELVIIFSFAHFWLAWEYVHVILNPGCQGDRVSLEIYGFPSEPIEFISRNGPVLRGWFSRGSLHPEIVIIALPGHAGNTYFALPEAQILAQAGYSTLLFEHRSCADPSLQASTGYYESYDVLGAIDFLRSRPDIEHIGAVGISEGGTAIILAAAQEPALEAIIPMGGYTSLEEDILDPRDQLSLYDRFYRQLVLWAMDWQLGVPASASSPVSVIGQIAPRPVLLIYGEYETANGQALYAAANEPKELWIVPGAGHAGYILAQPDEYQQRILTFFSTAFNTSSD